MSDATDAPRRVSPSVRKEVLSRDHHRCRICGQEGRDDGGYTTHHIHHIEDAPTHCGRNDPANLVTLCRQCHNWIHKRPSRSTVPIDLSDAADKRLLPQDYEFLEKLYEDGPLAIEELQARLTADLSQIAIRERLWLLMGLDRTVKGQDQQLLDHSATSGEWGHPADIDDSERGRIPDDNRTLRRRIEDERIRRSLDWGIDRQKVAEAFDVCPRTTRYKERRARAYALPLDQIDSSIVEDSGAEVPSRSDEATTQRARKQNSVGTMAADSSTHMDATTSNMNGEAPALPAVDSDAPSDGEGAAPGDALSTEGTLSDDAAPSEADPAGGRTDDDEFDQAMAVLDSGEDSDEKRLLLTVGLDDIERDALMRYCANQGHSLSEMLKEWVTEFSEELAE